jgi:hypothetical protein
MEPKDEIMQRIKQDENFTLKIVGEVGDISRLVLRLISRIDKLEQRIVKMEDKR